MLVGAQCHFEAFGVSELLPFSLIKLVLRVAFCVARCGDLRSALQRKAWFQGCSCPWKAQVALKASPGPY